MGSEAVTLPEHTVKEVPCSTPTPCYACSYREGLYGGLYAGGNMRQAEWRAILYEKCVEHLEELYAETFTISDAWRTMEFRGPENYNMMRNVVRDLYLHGHLLCAKRDKAGKCRLWVWA